MQMSMTFSGLEDDFFSLQGTEKRDQSSLEKEVEGMGAQLNSTVAREYTSYLGKCLSRDMPQS